MQSERNVQKRLFPWDGVGVCVFLCVFTRTCDWWEVAVSVCDTQVCFKLQHTGIPVSLFSPASLFPSLINPFGIYGVHWSNKMWWFCCLVSLESLNIYVLQYQSRNCNKMNSKQILVKECICSGKRPDQEVVIVLWSLVWYPKDYIMFHPLFYSLYQAFCEC